MSEEQLKAFLEKVKVDASLQEQLNAAADVDAVLAIAKEAGFSISSDDLKNAQTEVSDKELEGAAGGAADMRIYFTTTGNMDRIWDKLWKKLFPF